MKISLPSRAGAPEHCAECDGPRDTDDVLCTECAAAPLLQRIEWRYQNGEGVADWFDNDRWRIGRQFHPLHWRLGVDVEFDHVSASFSVGLGPWTFWVGWSA